MRFFNILPLSLLASSFTRERFLHDDFTICDGCSECDPQPEPEPEPPAFAVTEAFASYVHGQVRDNCPPSFLRLIAEVADEAETSVEEVAAEYVSRAIHAVNAFTRELLAASRARNITTSRLVARMVLTGTLGPLVTPFSPASALAAAPGGAIAQGSVVPIRPGVEVPRAPLAGVPGGLN